MKFQIAGKLLACYKIEKVGRDRQGKIAKVGTNHDSVQHVGLKGDPQTEHRVGKRLEANYSANGESRIRQTVVLMESHELREN